MGNTQTHGEGFKNSSYNGWACNGPPGGPMEAPRSLTYHSEIDLEVAGRAVAKIDPTPVHALVNQLDLIDEQLRRVAGGAEERPLAEVLVRGREPCLRYLPTAHIEVVQWLVVVLLEPEHHVHGIVALQWRNVTRQAGLLAQHSTDRCHGNCCFGRDKLEMMLGCFISLCAQPTLDEFENMFFSPISISVWHPLQVLDVTFC